MRRGGFSSTSSLSLVRHAGHCALIGLTFVLALYIGIVAAQAQEISPTAHAEDGVDGSSLRFDWPKAVALNVETVGREVLIRVDAPLGDIALDAMLDRMAAWIETVVFGYDSLLVVVRDNVAVAVRRDDKSVALTFSRGTGESRTENARPGDPGTDLRLSYLRALVMMQERDYAGARTALYRLHGEQPKRREIIEALILLETRMGHYAEARGFYAQALALAPDDPGLIEGRREVRRQHGPRLEASTVRQQVAGGDDQLISRVRGRAEVGDATTVTMTVEDPFV